MAWVKRRIFLFGIDGAMGCLRKGGVEGGCGVAVGRRRLECLLRLPDLSSTATVSD